MDQADKIIIDELRRCLDVELDKKIDSIGQFGAAEVVHCIGSCVNAISPNVKVKTKLPKSKAQQFRIGSKLSEAMKSIGYTREVGYETFIYPNEGDTRQLLRWLVPKLPRKSGRAPPPFFLFVHNVHPPNNEQHPQNQM